VDDERLSPLEIQANTHQPQLPAFYFFTQKIYNKKITILIQLDKFSELKKILA
jgi:hypothetical protein